MKALAVVCPASISSSSSWQQQHLPFRFRSFPKSQLRNSRFPVLSCLVGECLNSSSFFVDGKLSVWCGLWKCELSVMCQVLQMKKAEAESYKGGAVDELLLKVFRNKMVEEVGWDSDKPGYDGLIEVANRMMLKNPTNSDTKEAAVRVLISLFPPFLLELYKLLIAPIQGGKIAALMVARVTAISCQWLMGRCTVNSVDLPDGNSWTSGVFVEKCKYLEESKCVGICVNTCKLPTQSFFMDYMGVPLLMEPNFDDYSCQFKFGVLPPLPEDDATLKEPCLAICPNATRRRELGRNINVEQCPQA